VSAGGAKILLVEDDATLRHTLALNLRAEGYQLLEADDGESGLASARAETPALVVLDVMLPRLDGLTVCRLLRRESAVPIILLTARGAEADKIIGLETGADDYIVKPFSLGEFLARVRAALRRSAAALSGDVLTSGDLRLDLAARRVALAGRPVVLTPREFDLLALLLRHRGAVMSRGLLLARIWGDDYVGDARTVDVHIHWLRQKLEKDPARPALIQTVRGVGYRLED
jgi:DNA-binding response OmpR family regulator